MSRRPAVTVDIAHRPDHLDVRWSAGSRSGGGRLDHVPGSSPAWLGAADELLEGADRRTADRIVSALSDWVRDAGLDAALWHDGDGIEPLG